jgi:hypothetical protein
MIIVGESFMILAQVFSSKAITKGASFGQILKFNNWYIWVSVIGVFLVLMGYMYGIRISYNIWLVTIISWTALVVAEIIIARLVFQTMPSGPVLYGFMLVLIGFIVANL